jgi:cysteine synthase A
VSKALIDAAPVGPPPELLAYYTEENRPGPQPAGEGILSAVGSTPLVGLVKFLPDAHFRLYAKLEGLNPGGSSKDRPALSVIRRGIETGAIGPDTTIVESSSGNLGIGLAQACAYFGLRLICVVDAKTRPQNIRLMEAYGAETDIILDPDPETGEYLQARLNRVQTLLSTVENSFWPNQYANTYNPVAHHRTMREVLTQLDGRVDYLFCATSTCGTLRGCVEYVREHNLATKVVAVDALGSVIFGGPKAARLIPGHGAAVRPQLYRPDLADEVVWVSDLECVVGCRRLANSEAVLAGGSSGAVAMAVEKMRDDIPRDAVCVAIFPDRGERYLDTIYSDEWVAQHFGEVSHLWAARGKEQRCLTTYCS